MNHTEEFTLDTPLAETSAEISEASEIDGAAALPEQVPEQTPANESAEQAEEQREDVFTQAEHTLRERAHLADLERQAQALREEFPDFDLERELKNPVFARLTAPDVGIALEDAYWAVHRKELSAAAMREAAEKTAEKLAGAIRSGSRRPGEAGISSQAPFVSTFDYAKAGKQQREAFKKDLRARMARGEKVYPKN